MKKKFGLSILIVFLIIVAAMGTIACGCPPGAWWCKTPTPPPTEEPTVAPTEEPTQVPTEEPTVAPTEEPTQVPTEEPTVEPTIAPTEEPTETVAPPQPPAEEEQQIIATVAPTKVPTKLPTKAVTCSCCNLTKIDIMSMSGFTMGRLYEVKINSDVNQIWKIVVYEGSALDNKLVVTTGCNCSPFVINPVFGKTITVLVIAPDKTETIVEVSVKP